MKDLTQGKTSKVLISFAIPVFIGALFNLAYNIADTRIIGEFLGDSALAAVGSVGTLSDLIVGFMVGISNGFGVVVARHFGEKNEKEVKASFAQALSLGLIIAALLSAFSIIFIDQILVILRVEPENLLNAKDYITVILSGIVFSALYNLMVAGLRAIGDAYTPLFFLILSAIMNVGLDILFVGVLHTGVRGAAVATVISQIIAMLLCAIYTAVRYPIIRPTVKMLIPRGKYVSALLPAGISMGLMSSLVNFGTLALQTSINSLGSNTVVAHAATRKMSSLYMMPNMSVSTAMATFCGQNYGARRIDRIKDGLFKSLTFCWIWCVIVAIITYTIYPFFIRAITATDVDEIIETATRYQKTDVLFLALVPVISIVRNSLQGMGDHITPIVSSSLELVGKLVFALALTPLWGYTAVIWAEPVSWFIMVIPLIISMYRRLKNV